MDSGDDVVRKIMSATPAEIERSLAIVAGRAVAIEDLPLAIALQPGEVVIDRQPLDGIRLGRLLELPRSLVTLTFSGCDAADRTAFLSRFDRAFQRGGG